MTRYRPTVLFWLAFVYALLLGVLTACLLKAIPEVYEFLQRYWGTVVFP